MTPTATDERAPAWRQGPSAAPSRTPDWPAEPSLLPYLFALAAGALLELGALAAGLAHASSLLDLALISSPVALLFGLRNPAAMFPAFMFISQLKVLPWFSGVPFNLSVAFGFYVALVAAVHLARARRWAPAWVSGVLFVLLALLVTVAYQRSTMPVIAQMKLLYLVTFVSVSFLAPMVLFSSRERVHSFLNWMILTVTAMAVLMFVLAAGDPDAYVTERMGLAGSAPIPTGLAMMLGALASLLWWFPRARGLAERLAALAAAVVCGLGAMATGSRGPMMFGVLGLVIGGLLHAWTRTGRITGVAVRMGLVGVCLLALAFGLARSGVADRIPGTSRALSIVSGHAEGLGEESRVPLMATALKMIAERPWLGHGLGSYMRRLGRPDGADYTYPHNLLLDIGCEAGVPAAILLLVLYGRVLWRLLRPVLSEATPIAPAVIATFCLFLTAALESMVSTDFFRARITWGMAGVATAVGVLLVRGEFAQSDEPAGD